MKRISDRIDSEWNEVSTERESGHSTRGPSSGLPGDETDHATGCTKKKTGERHAEAGERDGGALGAHGRKVVSKGGG